jgi:hypothetical protein
MTNRAVVHGPGTRLRLRLVPIDKGSADGRCFLRQTVQEPMNDQEDGDGDGDGDGEACGVLGASLAWQLSLCKGRG